MRLNFTYILLGVLVALAIVGGVAITVLPGASAGDVQVVEIAPTPTPVPTSTPVPPEPDVGVYISGAVVNPGVYIMYEGSRLASVLLLAGGATENADLSAINLAVVVQDEDHWHIPKVGEPRVGEPRVGEKKSAAGGQASNGGRANSRSANGNAAASSAQSGQGSGGKVNLNSADVTLLKTLPNIGEVRAQAIVSHREANGDFASIDALLEVDGIGIGIIDNIRDLVSVE
ncbi:MAG: helix-hairpin-helix domain-containing protein [Chloroflexota bacterium]|nr:helix-hairpin-helix domain-containing protein [Chloroflexota bacterium]